MPGKHYIEKAVTAAIAEYAAEKKHDWYFKSKGNRTYQLFTY
jgi:hypothetical protein